MVVCARTSTAKICHIAPPCVAYAVLRAAIIPRHVSAPCMSYVVSDGVCAGRASPCRCVQSRAAATPCIWFSGRVHVYVCVRFCVYARSCVCAHATTSSSRARLRRHVCRMCRVRRQQFITCRVVVSWCVWAHDHEGLRAMMSPISVSRARLP